MNSQRIAKNAESLIKRQVTKLDFNSSYLVIEGSAWFEKYPEKDAERIIKSLILINDQAEEIEIPLVNTTVERPGFPASGYHGDVNFSTISDGKPLIPGTYEIKLQLQQYLGKCQQWTCLLRITRHYHLISVTLNVQFYSIHLIIKIILRRVVFMLITINIWVHHILIELQQS
ncbi:hypothetical protein WP50_35755 [Lactiplantibacillus plantarum]|nr:hypothetical protein WP50_35755 [Lactiplantibacillus plantarum]